MNVNIDNSRCKKDVKNIKVHLKVHYKGIAMKPSKHTRSESFTVTYYRVQDTRVPKFGSERFEIEIDTPKSFPKLKHAYKMQEFAKRVQPTFHGKLITVDYELRIFVKHDAWNEWGQGKVVCLPIRLMTPHPSDQDAQRIAAQNNPNPVQPMLVPPIAAEPIDAF
mmetsp:Transcript_29139/g.36144  ORF Transcript_29139/g.36144 Transcript_29139/m.36144 type:complete len:165 (+) Transcript_29139:652-1146(+)